MAVILLRNIINRKKKAVKGKGWSMTKENLTDILTAAPGLAWNPVILVMFQGNGEKSPVIDPGTRIKLQNPMVRRCIKTTMGRLNIQMIMERIVTVINEKDFVRAGNTCLLR